MTTNMQKENKEMASEMQVIPNGQAIKNELSGTVTIKSSDKSVKFGEKWWVVAAQILVIPVLLAWGGWWFTQDQARIAREQQDFDREIANYRQDADSADKAIETREQVLTDYSKAIAELVTDKKLRERDPLSQDLARGQTLITLRRLNVPDEQINHDGSKVDRGELKGLLIRYLFDSKLINYNPTKPIINLAGADITNIVLRDAWLHKIHLNGAFLNNADFGNADLTQANLSNSRLTAANFHSAILSGANLQSTNLSGANLQSADLRKASLTNAILTNAKLDGACYVKGTEAQYFPPGFNPMEHNMIAIPEDQSNLDKPNQFKSCPSVLTP